MEGKKRRLSSGSGQLKMYDEDGSDTDCDSTIDGRSFTQESSIYSFPKRGANRSRRSSIGSQKSAKRELNPQEQARITEMYKTVIQLSSENKINDKNSWTFDLIDHMGRLIKDENKSVNFLKASCTLDASVKIYSHRVDDTYSTSHRILESLSRNNGAGRNVDDADAAGGDDDDGDDDGSHDGDAGGNRKKTKGRLGSKAAHRAHLSQTIERNAALLNAVKLENDYFVDPMFHKISKAFDEGGAKGMLMNNLRLKPGTCQLRFHFEANENAPIVDESVSASFCGDAPADSTSCPALCADEVAALLGRAAIDAAELQSLEVCPPLNIYRENLGILNENADSLREILSAIDSIDGDAQPYNDQFPTFETKSDYGPAADDDACAAGHFEYDGCGDANDDDYCDDGDCFGIVSPIAPSAGESVADVVPTKLRWGRPSDSDKDVVSEAALAADVQMLTAGLENLNVAGREEEYSFFDTNSLFASNSNAWAGAKHWKFATKRRAVTPATASAAAATSIDAADEDNAALAGCDQLQSTRGKQQAKGKKKQAPAQYIDFSKVDQLDEDVFDIPSESQGRGKSVSDATLLSESVQAKAESFAASLFLPPDAKLEVKDLCRLFLSPTVMIPSSAQQRIALTKSASLAQTESIDGAAAEGRQRLARLLGGGEMAMEKVWGVQPTYLYPTKALLAAGHLTAVGSNGNNERSNDECYDDQFGDDAYDAGEASFDMDYDGAVCDHPAAETHGLAINQDQLLQASRTVGKIEISYAKVSKRVNIQRLKTDIWDNITGNLDPKNKHSSDASENEPPVAAGKEEADEAEVKSQMKQLSFKDMISNVSCSQSHQKDATLPFYFICLLHLANEHTLRIDGQDDLGDLAIKLDT